MPANPIADTGTRPTPQQLRLLIAQEIDKSSVAFNHAVLLRPDPSVDHARFHAAVVAVAARHDALRARIPRGGPDGWTVRNGSPAPHESNVVALADADLLERAQREVDRPFDLNNEAPMRVSWWHVGDAVACQLTFHHSATDARTVDLILNDLRTQYDANTADDDEGTGYYGLADDAWKRQTTPDHLKRLQDYVLRVAECDLTPILPTPADRRRETTSLSWTVPAAVDQAVRAHARTVGCTRFAVWLTAWTRALALVLDRWDMPVAVPVSTRQSQADLAIVGFFVNSVVIPVHHDRGESFIDACRRVSSAILDALDSRDVPLHELVNHLDLSEHGVDNPLTAVSAQLLPAERATIELRDGPVAIHFIEATTPRYQISFDVREAPHGVRGRICADQSLIDPVRLHVFQPLMEHDILGEPVATSSSSKPPTAQQLQPNSVLIAPIRQWSLDCPNGIAVRWANGQWTWAQLRYAADATATRLRHRGVQAGDAVTIELPRGPDYVAALIAVLQLDAIPVMTRAGWTQAVRTNVAVSLQAAARIIAPNSIHRPLTLRPGVRDTGVLPAGTAYVTFTSGSTGPPKGVPAPLAGVIAYLDWVAAVTAIGPPDRCLQVAAPGFDALIRDTLTPLRSQATLVILPDELRLSGEGIAGTLRDEDITAVLAIIPPQLRLVLDHLHPPAPRIICVAGEPLFRTDAERLHRIDPASRLLNLYGPTETTMTTTFHEVMSDSDQGNSLHVGHPMPSAGIHVVGPDGAELPFGCSGEVIVSGAGVAPGYLADTDNASTRFAFRALDGYLRWSYATGDNGYWLDDSNGLRLGGRRDAEHKVNGERVDLAAIEAALTEHPAVTDAMAAVERHGQLSIVTAHVVLRDPHTNADDLRNFLDGKISGAAAPRRITAVARLPRLDNGKADRAHLPPTQHDVATAVNAPPSWSRVQQTVAAVVGCVPTDPQATLFELGADSLKVIAIIERLGLLQTAPDYAMRVFDDPRLTNLVRLLDQSIDDASAHVRKAPMKDSLALMNSSTILPDGPTIICFPPAGGDQVSFTPLLSALDGQANLIVALRPSAHHRQVPAAGWADLHVLAVARHVANRPGPILLCGYSVGFLLACLTADALALNHGRQIHSLIGINPSIARTSRAVDRSDDANATLLEPSITDAWDRLTADLSIRNVTQRLATDLPRLLLLQGDEDRRRWDTTTEGTPTRRFASVQRTAIPGNHMLSAAHLHTAGQLIRQWTNTPEMPRDGI